MPITLFIPPILQAKRAMRSALATATDPVVGNGLSCQVTWLGHVATPATPPDPLPLPIAGDRLTLVGEVVADDGTSDPDQPHMFTDEPATFAIVVNASVSRSSTMSADDYLDLLAAEVQTIVMADRTLAGTARNVTYKGFQKQDVAGMTGLRVLIVNFEVRVRYPADNPLAGAQQQTI